MKVVVVVQARMASARLPGKVMAEIGGRPIIDLLVTRLSRAERVDEVIVATSEEPADDVLAAHLERAGTRVYRGSERDVLGRVLEGARAASADVLVRVTGDCPFVSAELVDRLVELILDRRVDYASNVEPASFPDGLDVEVMTVEALARSAALTRNARDREHVTLRIREGDEFSRCNLASEQDLSALRLTVDEPQDLEVVRALFDAAGEDAFVDWRRLVELLDAHPEIGALNAGFGRDEGMAMGTGQKLWRRARRVVPGGNMLLSKRPEMFLPEGWPAYFDRASGARVTDLDGNEYIDVSLMGVGTNTLGYGHPEVDAAVTEVVRRGNLSTLNCPEEVWLAERLVELEPWADMVRFARTGGEANAMAIRIARAAAGRDAVAVCGYHGWHDWYLSANLANESNLDGHLLPGLDPAGVPRALRGCVLPFDYNDLQGLERLTERHSVGVIKMEVMRNAGPEPGFLEGVRELATRKGIVLVFDECTSGFRETLGGLAQRFGVEPDVTVFGKTLGNGYAITAVLGRRDVMEAAQRTFISSTFWTERIGPAAALKALEVMERERSWELISRTGRDFRGIVGDAAAAAGLRVEFSGIPALTTFALPDFPQHALACKTFITQQMLRRGYLASNAFYASLAHDRTLLSQYGEAIAEVFAELARLADGGRIEAALDGPVCHGGFQRLN